MSPQDSRASSDAGGASMQKTVRREVEIPIRVLQADDCDERWSSPPSLSPLTERAVQFAIPPGSPPGSLLDIPVGGDAEPRATVCVPAYARDGDVMRMQLREDGSWRVSRLLQEFSFSVPPGCEPGDVLKVPGPDGRTLSFAVPQGVRPEDLVRLRRGESGWAFGSVLALPELEALPQRPAEFCGPYAALLRLLKERGCAQALPVDSGGTLRVNVPFCGRLHEHRVLGGFVSDLLSARRDIRGAELFATEVCSDYAHDWAVAERWCRERCPGVALRAGVCDLAEDPLTDAGLAIAIHPEATKGGRWFQIIGNLVRSARAGVCLLATFYEVEMQTVVNMVRMYMAEGTEIEVVQNPHYEDHQRPEPPPMRYLVIVTGPGVRLRPTSDDAPAA